MKIAGKILCALLFAAAAFFAGGCQVLDVFSVDSLIRPPKLTGENARIQQAFEAAVGSDVTLVNPLLGDYRSAFVFNDYDNDGVDETLVFYTRNDAPNEIRMNFMDREAQNWFSVCDIAGNGSEVYRVEFLDIDGDKRSEVAVTWTVADSKRNKTLAVYRQQQDAEAQPFAPLSVIQLLDYLILDFDFDGRMDILYLYSDTTVQSQLIKASMIRFDGAQQSFVPVSEVELSRSVEYPIAVAFDRQDGVYRAYFDCISFDGTYITEILVFDAETSALVRPVDEQGEALCLRTVRNDDLLSRDRYGSSLIDVPVCFPYKEASRFDTETEISSDLYVTQFMNLRDGVFEPASPVYYCDAADGYMLRLDDYLEKFYLIHRTTENAILFYLRTDPENVVFAVRFNQNSVRGRDKYSVTVYRSPAEAPVTAEDVKKNITEYQR